MAASMAAIVTLLAMLYSYFAMSHDTWPLPNKVRNFAGAFSKLDAAHARLDLSIQRNGLQTSAFIEVAYKCPLALTPIDSESADTGMFRFNWQFLKCKFRFNWHSLLHMLSRLFWKEPTTSGKSASGKPTRAESVFVKDSPSSKIIDLGLFHQTAQDVVREVAEHPDKIVVPSESSAGNGVEPADCKPEVQGEEPLETSQDICKHNIFDILENFEVKTQGVEEEMKSLDDITVPSEATTGHEVLPPDQGEELPGTALAIIDVQSNRGLKFINLLEWASETASAIKNKWSQLDWTIGTWSYLDWTARAWSKLSMTSMTWSQLDWIAATWYKFDWTSENRRLKLVLLMLIAVMTASMQVCIFLLTWPRKVNSGTRIVESEPPDVNPGPRNVRPGPSVN